MSCETILVTGGAGYVGSHVIVELIGAGYATVILDNRKEAIQGSWVRIKTLNYAPNFEKVDGAYCFWSVR